MIISYHGNNTFKVLVGAKITSSDQIPPFHSRSIIVGQTIYFDHCITNKKNLVSAKLFILFRIFSYNFTFYIQIA
jgi:hypothetical protein